MPLYEYRCAQCGHEIEVLQKVADPFLKDCEACHQPTLQRAITSPRFRLKGSGYYETDEKPKTQQRHIASDSSTESTSAVS